MNTNLFFVAPSEAMLLGLATEEYFLLRKSIPSLSFTQIKRVRIDPFVADLSSKRITRLSEEDMPADLEPTLGLGPDTFRRATEPNTLYGRDGEGPFRITKDFKKNFDWLLITFLAPHLGVPDWLRHVLEQMSQDNVDSVAIDDAIAYGKAQEEQHSDGSFGNHGEFDIPLEIEESVGRLIEFNELDRFFQIGRQFGAINAGLHLYAHASNARSSAEAVFTFGGGLVKLIETPEILRSAVAHNALSFVLNVFNEEFVALYTAAKGSLEDPSEDRRSAALDLLRRHEERRKTIQPEMNRYWHIVWVAFGEVLGTIRDLDQDAKQQDAASVMPRTFGIGRNETPDRIRKWLGDCERELAYGTGQPERVVVSLKDSMEALAKRLWKTEIDAYRGAVGLPSILLDKAKRGNSTQERRFGQLALSLYHAYRNEATHEQDSFRCNISEARHFISGIRVLLDLFDEIKSQASK